MDEVLKIYQDVFKVAQHFLKQSKFYNIEELAQHNEPTYEQVAELAQLLAGILAQMAANGGWDEERVALNASQAAMHMHEMARAISKKDKEALGSARAKLSNMTFV
ncbi:hypothetical protein NMV64_003369 [Vibrio cholerae]|nr:hypothetical protein [Vibrio cholerae]EJL7180956.1 hypothetical protein [Vibrio cholerae]